MIVAYSEHDIARQTNSVVTVGTFDGVHLGHQSIIETLCMRAKTIGGRSVAMTFHPHPREVVGQEQVKYLSTLEERLHFFELLNVDAVRIVNFTYEFSRSSPQDFYEQYVVRQIGVKEVVVGHDHMFGRDRKAGILELQDIGKKFGFNTVSVSPLSLNGDIVSSSFVRKLVESGDVERTKMFLGHPYSLQGTVINGDGRGKQIGFPTANIQPDNPNKLVPASGVYVVKTEINSNTYYGMMNIGVRPTFNANLQVVIEVHIFDFASDLYGKAIKVYFLKRLREEKKFSSKEELVAQLKIDEQQSKQYLAEIHLSI